MFFEFIPASFKKNKTLKKSGLSGFFSATLELTKEGLIDLLQKKRFDKLSSLKEKNEKKK